MIRRRDFITLLGGAAVIWPLEARAQAGKLPVIGFLHMGLRAPNAYVVAGFREGLKQFGYIEGENVAIEYRWADNQADDCRNWRPIWSAVR